MQGLVLPWRGAQVVGTEGHSVSYQFHSVISVACLKDVICAEAGIWFHPISVSSSSRLPHPGRGDVSERDVRRQHITEGWKKEVLSCPVAPYALLHGHYSHRLAGTSSPPPPQHGLPAFA